ncbi:hypothetical protein [Streptomyces sp. VRA16 Mangrove soil]|uniref:hypothetical protein n=1 Tax=Streptomyces sp. VRA16 Mangrove soil TaxID=2817434 RepID=UPI001A9DABB7|nr:hypothetical protein [Streptomyces sp. VRA16 Mangrove soil]MBO1334669.1 hypothetical protein [Streptomyces sp. VRA16 Mangrove soil]
MNLRRTTTTRRALAAVAFTTGLVLSAGGCGGDGGDKPEKAPSTASADKGNDKQESQSASPSSQVLAEVKGENGITLSVTSAQRDEGGFVTVQGNVTNGTGKGWVPVDWRGDEKELMSNGGSIAGAALVDEAGKKKYLVLRDTEGRCLCTRFTGGVRNGETDSWYAQFPAPPEGTTKVTFQVGSMPPAAIDISEGE